MAYRYRVVLDQDQSVVANGLTQEQAHECVSVYALNYPTCTYTIERYTQEPRWRLGRDPDLHT